MFNVESMLIYTLEPYSSNRWSDNLTCSFWVIQHQINPKHNGFILTTLEQAKNIIHITVSFLVYIDSTLWFDDVESMWTRGALLGKLGNMVR